MMLTQFSFLKNNNFVKISCNPLPYVKDKYIRNENKEYKCFKILHDQGQAIAKFKQNQRSERDRDNKANKMKRVFQVINYLRVLSICAFSAIRILLK